MKRKDRFDLIPHLRRREITYEQIAVALDGRPCTIQNVGRFIAGQNNSRRVAVAISALTGFPVEAVLAGRAA